MNPRFLKGTPCVGCALQHNGFGFVPPTGPPNARLRFLGESAGYEEAIHGEPFYGPAGGVLSRVLVRAGVNRAAVRISNTLACRPPGDYLVGAPWEEHAIGQCQAYREPELALVPDDAVVVPLGATALTTLLGIRGVAGIQVKDFHGTVSRDPSNRFWVVPTFHPSHLQRGAMNLLEVVTQDIQLADRISQRGFTRTPTTLMVDPPVEWFRQWIEGYLSKLAADPSSTHLAIDTEFAEKAGGADESEVVLGTTSSPITRVNGACDGTIGWTVPYTGVYRSWVKYLLEAASAQQAWIWLWNKYADLDHLWRDAVAISNESTIDAMWLWHYLQSDLPRGLGFVAAMASDFGPWKHWGKVKAREGEYAAADGVQTWRTAMWLLRAAQQQGVWDVFLTDWHERDVYVLRPAYVQGTPADRPALEQFHADLQVKLANVLTRIKETAARGVLKPKAGYAKRPMVKCAACKGTGRDEPAATDEDGPRVPCFVCHGEKRVVQLTPPASILGKPKKGGGEAKSTYMLEGVKLVEVEIEVDVRICETCRVEDVGNKHRCKLQRQKPQARTRPRRGDPVLHDSGDVPSPVRPVPVVVSVRRQRRRYFWQLPFNPDAPAQVLQYLADQGITAPVDKKKQRATTAKKELEKLRTQHADDPFFQLQLDWKAVQKVDSTYAVGALTRLDKDDRLHPEFVCKPSTFRDSCVGINLQNVVADKAGVDGLAAGFRRCIVSRDGIPSDRTPEELVGFEERWS